MIEFSRRSDGRFNVWQVIEGEWTVVSVCDDHREALAEVRRLRDAWHSSRDLKVAA